MPDKPDSEEPLGIQGLLGVGLDSDDGKKRVSRGPNFVLMGGSRDTHERMQEVAVRFNERQVFAACAQLKAGMQLGADNSIGRVIGEDNQIAIVGQRGG